MIRPFYFKDKTFYILDQRRLPLEETWIACTSSDKVAQAIRTLAVRGAPAIGIAASFGLVLEASKGRAHVETAAGILINARPTAVNLAWAIKRCIAAIGSTDEKHLPERLQHEAETIWQEEIEANESMALLGASLFEQGREFSILTHCNAGSLATGGIGTAIGIIRKLHEQHKLTMVYVDETRPLLQGARITAYELNNDSIPCTLITDSMAGWLMKQARVDAVIIGADRIAFNHDTANKVGSYSLAVLAHAHGIPFYVAAPRSTFDPATPTGDDITIEERDADEVIFFKGIRCAPRVKVFNPSFDVVPHELITAIISETEIHPVNAKY
jgi:methylthioribose-1-phosphate isomerase